MNNSKSHTLTLFEETDFSLLHNAPLQLVEIKGPIFGTPSSQQLLAYCFFDMNACYSKRKPMSIAPKSRIITFSNNDVIEHWKMVALCTDHQGKTSVLLVCLHREKRLNIKA
ncbi:hypothetical protein [Vibrio superstes]|uniref:hypothetical protein n=1 Tax=Vibrio superstes TaxID=198815 RepID=UPI000E5BAB7D|nr:hypothetical protein [Vibrio superstes]